MTVIGAPLSERQLLGCLLLGTERALIDRLEIQDFTRPLHRAAFAAIQALHSGNQPIESCAVVSEINRRRDFGATVDGLAVREVLDLTAEVVTPLSAKFYLADVLEHRVRRRAQEAGERMIQAAEIADMDAVLDVLQRESAAIDQHLKRRQALE